MTWTSLTPLGTPHSNLETVKSTSMTMLEVMRLAQQMFAATPLQVVGAHSIQVMWLAHRLAQAAGAYEQAAVKGDVSSTDFHSFHQPSSGSRALTPLQVMWAGLLHDIGKLDLPSSLIDKPGQFTPEEQTRMRAHPMLGFHRVRQLAELWPHTGIDQIVLEGILHHHERFDGQGYPVGLVGESIPLLARILTVADVYSALTSRRPYREAWTPCKAIDYMQHEQGRMFDPHLIRLVPQVFRAEDHSATQPFHAEAMFPTGIY